MATADPLTKPLLFSSILRRPYVEITVGPEGSTETFVIHLDIICNYSPFFDAAFNGPFSEGASRQMRIDDVDPIPFSHVAAWLYTDALDEIGESQEPSEDESGDRIRLLGEIWILAERFLMPLLQDAAVETLCKDLPMTPMLESLRFLSLICDSSAYELLQETVAECVEFCDDEHFISTIGELPELMVVDIAKCLAKIARRSA